VRVTVGRVAGAAPREAAEEEGRVRVVGPESGERDWRERRAVMREDEAESRRVR